MENKILKEKLPKASELLVINTTLTFEEVGIKINEVCERITNVNIDGYELLDLKEYLKELKEDEKVYKADRIGYFKPYTNIINDFNKIDKALSNKAKEVEVMIYNMESEEREALEQQREAALVGVYANYITPQEMDALSKWSCFISKRTEYVSKEITRNILTDKGALKKSEREKFELFLNNFNVALKTLSPIGISKFESTLDLGTALAFEKEMKELQEKEIIEREAKRQADAQIIEHKVVERVEDAIPEVEVIEEVQAPTRVVELYYDESNMEIRKELGFMFGRLNELGVEYKIK